MRVDLARLVMSRYEHGKADGLTWDDMAARAVAAGYPSFTKTNLWRAAHEPLKRFPTQNLPAFAAALGVTMTECLCACAESLYGNKYRFTPAERADGQWAISVTEVGMTGAGQPPRLVVWDMQLTVS